MPEHSHDPTLIPSTVDFHRPPQADGELVRLGQFRIVKQLGRGGMGFVYEVQDTQLHRRAALKVMRPEYAAHGDARERFLREAQAAARLKHDHIVTIYQVGEENNVPYLAMEFLAGKSLDEWLRPDRRATVAETLLIGKQIAKGLAAAHAAGLIHRDIKPANVWLEAPRGRVKILDFGLARRMDGELAALTQDGSVLGTPAFMAPEQARGEAVDHRCDLFSLGCVLYRMLTGRLPFQGSTTYAVLTAIASETPPPVISVRKDVPLRLSQLVERLLAKQASARPASAQAVFDQLAAIEKDVKLPAAAQSLLASPGKRSPWPWVAAAATIAAATAIVVSLLAWQGFFNTHEGSGEPTVAGKDQKVEPVIDPIVETSPVEQASRVDLLRLIDIERDRVNGSWSRPARGKLQVLAGESPRLGLRIPWSPPEEYRLRMKLTRLDRDGMMSVGLSSGESRFALMFDMKKDSSAPRTGISVIDGRDLFEQRGPHVGVVLPPQVPNTIVITVHKQGVSAEVNGAQLVQWTGNPERLKRFARDGGGPKIRGEKSKKLPDEVRQSLTELRQAPLNLVGAGSYLIEELVLEPLGDERGQPIDWE